MDRENVYDFSKSLRGYNTEEVNSYIDSLKEKFRALEEEKIVLAERAAEAKARLDESNTKRGLAERELADAEKEAERIEAEARERAETIIEKAKAAAEAIEADAKLRSDGMIGAAVLEEKRVNERLERSIVEKERIYNAFCDKLDNFKRSVFAEYAAHISALEGILSGKVPESYVIPTENKTEKKEETAPEPKKEEIAREEVIAPIAGGKSDLGKGMIEKSLGIKISRESGRGEKVSSIMRELDEIKGRIAEKEKKVY